MDIDRSKFVSSAISDAELVIGIVAPVGAREATARETIEKRLRLFDYELIPIRISELIRGFELQTKLDTTAEFDRIRTHMDAGNELRDGCGRADVLALAAINDIRLKRAKSFGPTIEERPRKRVAYLLWSLKHP